MLESVSALCSKEREDYSIPPFSQCEYISKVADIPENIPTYLHRGCCWLAAIAGRSGMDGAVRTCRFVGGLENSIS